MKKELVLKNEMAEIGKLADFIVNIAGELSLPLPLATSLNLAMEEAVSNVILYAYPNKGNTLKIEAETNCGELTFKVIDSGVPFDPTLQTDPDITLPADERPVGGLGIFLVRQIMDKVAYERINEKNVLILTKIISYYGYKN